MCGISGFNWGDENIVKKMTETLNHRGPDATGVYVDKNVSLGHNRLSIIDLDERSNQPMLDATGNLVIVYNGEIYNFQELKRELANFYNFQTKSDTEVILAGYKKWGKGVLDRLNGMFAFAIWDKSRQELFMARDHAGIKPFYYMWDGKRFIFASEIKAILQHDLVGRSLNTDAFNRYLRVLYVPAPDTMIQGVCKLPASCYAILKGRNFSVEEYGKEKIKAGSLAYQDAVNKKKIIYKSRRKWDHSISRSADLTLTKKLIGFDAEISFEVGLEKTYESFKDFFNT